MKTFVIHRRRAWSSPQELERAAGRSARVGREEMAGQIRWVRSYVLDEEDGRLGTVCVYQAVSPEAIREHARLAGLPVDEIIPVGRTVVINDDPVESAR